MSSLYDLVGERLALQNKLESLDFDAETIADTLEGDSLAIQSKIEDYAYVITNMESNATSLSAEIKRLQAREKAFHARVQSIKDWLMMNMQAAEITKISSAYFTIALQNNPVSVVIENEALISDRYKTLPAPPVPQISKTLIKDAIERGEIVIGAHLEKKQRVVIK